jgi:hypothetical protein
MAADAANITSLDALKTLRTALARFAAEVEAALVALELEGRRPVEWVEVDRTQYWPQQARRAADVVNEARQALARCEQRINGEDARYCYDERKALEKAKRRLQLTEEKIQAVRRWRMQIRKEFEEFSVQIAKSRRFLETDVVHALSALERMSAALDRYVQQSAISTEAAS